MALLFYLLLLLPTAALWAQGAAPDYKYFKGTVNGQYSITMELQQEGEQVEGSYFYDKYRTLIPIKGTVGADGSLTLKEVDAAGNPTSSTFVGTYTSGWSNIHGQWKSKTGEYQYSFNLQAIQLPKGPIGRYNFDQIRRFQELLNYFDAEPKFPFRVQEGMGESPRWKNLVSNSTSSPEDYQQVIPYRLAKRYIMNQVLLAPEGSYNYFNLPAESYHSSGKHYTALCKVYQSSNYVGLLCRFKCDTGWQNYDITFLLLYDYAGHLLDACKVGKVLNLEGDGQMVTANWSSHFSKDGRIEVTGTTEKTYYGDTALDQQLQTVHFYWLVQANGRLRQKDIASK